MSHLRTSLLVIHGVSGLLGLVLLGSLSPSSQLPYFMFALFLVTLPPLIFYLVDSLTRLDSAIYDIRRGALKSLELMKNDPLSYNKYLEFKGILDEVKGLDRSENWLLVFFCFFLLVVQLPPLNLLSATYYISKASRSMLNLTLSMRRVGVQVEVPKVNLQVYSLLTVISFGAFLYKWLDVIDQWIASTASSVRSQ